MWIGKYRKCYHPSYVNVKVKSTMAQSKLQSVGQSYTRYGVVRCTRQFPSENALAESGSGERETEMCGVFARRDAGLAARAPRGLPPQEPEGEGSGPACSGQCQCQCQCVASRASATLLPREPFTCILAGSARQPLWSSARGPRLLGADLSAAPSSTLFRTEFEGKLANSATFCVMILIPRDCLWRRVVFHNMTWFDLWRSRYPARFDAFILSGNNTIYLKRDTVRCFIH